MNSALPRIVQPVSSEACFSLINGVLPIASMTSLLIFMRKFLLAVDLWKADSRAQAMKVEAACRGFCALRLAATSSWRKRPDERRYFLRESLPHNRPDNIPTAAGTARQSRAE